MNVVSLAGLALAAIVFAVGVVFLVLDIVGGGHSPYLGIITYLVVPGLLTGALGLVALGMYLTWRRRRRGGAETRLPVVDFGNRRTLVRLVIFGMLASVIGVVSVLASYRMYHFTESTGFCGTVCHEVMEPEYTAFQHSPHAGASCTGCHIGPGAEWFVKAKLSGIRQVFAVLANSFHRPIETPVQSLRPAKETCLTCHWPAKFFGPVLRTWTHYQADETNTPWSVKMLINVGGGNPAHGRIQGIHWHMEGVNTVEYIAADPRREVIPWVRVTDQTGTVTVYRTEDPKARLTDAQVAAAAPRRMDCMDCHNRPSHQFRAPNELLDLALSTGRIDASLPGVKAAAAALLAGSYATKEQALEAIARGIQEKYPGDPRVAAAVRELQSLYAANFFPAMKARWDAYPNHVGHKISAGCFRCHDGQHVSESGRRISKECNLCHTILAQGPGKELGSFTSAGLEFQHPEDVGDAWKTERCDTCHTGKP
jgi:hypothetical protein